MKGIRVVPEAKERDRLAFAFMSNEISSERQVEMAVDQTAAIMRQVREDGKKIVAVAGPVVVHTGGGEPLSRLIRGGWIDALLAGNALGCARYRICAAGHIAGRSHVGWPTGRAWPSQSHARHQRHQSCRRHRRQWKAGGSPEA